MNLFLGCLTRFLRHLPIFFIQLVQCLYIYWYEIYLLITLPLVYYLTPESEKFWTQPFWTLAFTYPVMTTVVTDRLELLSSQIQDRMENIVSFYDRHSNMPERMTNLEGQNEDLKKLVRNLDRVILAQVELCQFKADAYKANLDCMSENDQELPIGRMGTNQSLTSRNDEVFPDPENTQDENSYAVLTGPIFEYMPDKNLIKHQVAVFSASLIKSVLGTIFLDSEYRDQNLDLSEFIRSTVLAVGSYRDAIILMLLRPELENPLKIAYHYHFKLALKNEADRYEMNPNSQMALDRAQSHSFTTGASPIDENIKGDSLEFLKSILDPEMYFPSFPNGALFYKVHLSIRKQFHLLMYTIEKTFRLPICHGLFPYQQILRASGFTYESNRTSDSFVKYIEKFEKTDPYGPIVRLTRDAFIYDNYECLIKARLLPDMGSITEISAKSLAVLPSFENWREFDLD